MKLLCNYYVIPDRPKCLIKESVCGSLPLNSLNMSNGGKLPPKLSIVSLNFLPINFKSSEFSRSASSNIENASALRTSAHLYE